MAASAQSGRAYNCSYNSGGSYVSIMFGPDEVRYRSTSAGGGWGQNICDEWSSCEFKGSMFIADGSDFNFVYDTQTTRFSFSDSTGTIEGICRPE